MVELTMSKRPDFTPAEVELLRSYARRLQEERKLTGTQLGALMGIRQQNASAFTKQGAIGGIGRIAANRLADSQGFRDAEQLLAELRFIGAVAEVGMGNVWSARDSARRMAEAVGVAKAAIEAVIKQRTSPADAKRPVKWWLYEFQHQERQMMIDGEVKR